MYFHGCPVTNENGELLPYEEFMQLNPNDILSLKNV